VSAYVQLEPGEVAAVEEAEEVDKGVVCAVSPINQDLREMIQEAVAQEARRNRRRASNFCYHCKRPGHTKSNCWKLHPEQLDTFFSGYRGPFPPVVAIDESRRSFLDYGISGTPTFVLIGADGRIVRQKVGYSRTKGLEVLADS
jgi:hypothetical protein